MKVVVFGEWGRSAAQEIEVSKESRQMTLRELCQALGAIPADLADARISYLDFNGYGDELVVHVSEDGIEIT